MNPRDVPDEWRWLSVAEMEAALREQLYSQEGRRIMDEQERQAFADARILQEVIDLRGTRHPEVARIVQRLVRDVEELKREAEERKARRTKQPVRNAYKLGVTKAGSPHKRGDHD